MPEMPVQAFGPDDDAVEVSSIALGCMGLAGTWNPQEVGQEHRHRAIAAFETALESGITVFDHADFYGGTACESIFKDCLAAVPGSREQVFIATKVGIRPGFYDHSPDYIRESLHGSLKRMDVEYVDLYQLHRPDPLSHPAETAEVLDELVEEGLIRNIGVSNYYPQQMLALMEFLEQPIVSNQIRFSLLHLPPLYEGREGGGGDGVLDFGLEWSVTPMAYSPLGGGWLSGRREVPADHPKREQIERTLKALRELGPAYDDATPAQLAIAWILQHPAQIIPIVGSTNPDHIREFAAAGEIELTREDWYRLWVAARGEPVP